MIRLENQSLYLKRGLTHLGTEGPVFGVPSDAAGEISALDQHRKPPLPLGLAAVLVSTCLESGHLMKRLQEFVNINFTFP